MMTDSAATHVDFLIIGAAKCATTWLQNSLQASPGIFMPDPELHFFSREYDRGFDWFDSYFTDAPAGSVIGEKSNSYLTEPAAAQRIHDAFPKAKLILQMRNPVQRAYSDYCMLFRRGEVTGDIDRYLDPDRAAEGRFLNDGLYAHHLERFHALFDPKQILLLAYEDVAGQPERQLQLLAEHIGYDQTLSAPLKDKVKDRNTAVVPSGLRRILRPLRPVLDPLRHREPIKSIRNAMARQVAYPNLSDSLRNKMWRFYADDIAAMQQLAPSVTASWKT